MSTYRLLTFGIWFFGILFCASMLAGIAGLVLAVIYAVSR